MALVKCTLTTGLQVLEYISKAQQMVLKLETLAALCPNGGVDPEILHKCAEYLDAVILKFDECLED